MTIATIPEDDDLPVSMCAYLIADTARFLARLHRHPATSNHPALAAELDYHLGALTRRLTHLITNGHP